MTWVYRGILLGLLASGVLAEVRLADVLRSESFLKEGDKQTLRVDSAPPSLLVEWSNGRICPICTAEGDCNPKPSASDVGRCSCQLPLTLKEKVREKLGEDGEAVWNSYVGIGRNNCMRDLDQGIGIKSGDQMRCDPCRFAEAQEINDGKVSNDASKETINPMYCKSMNGKIGGNCIQGTAINRQFICNTVSANDKYGGWQVQDAGPPPKCLQATKDAQDDVEKAQESNEKQYLQNRMSRHKERPGGLPGGKSGDAD